VNRKHNTIIEAREEERFMTIPLNAWGLYQSRPRSTINCTLGGNYISLRKGESHAS
jgi:hypothetical protein